MSIRQRLRDLDERLSRSATLHRLHRLLEQVLPLVVVALVIVLYLEFFVHLDPVHHDILIRTEQAILAYFILELAVKRGIHTDNREYLQDNWLDILLVVPFFAAVSGITRLLRSLKGIKALKGAKAAKGAKGAKGLKAAKGAKATKGAKLLHGKRLAKVSKHGKKAKKGAKVIKKGKEILEETAEGLLKALRD